MADNLIQPFGTGITTPERTAKQTAQALTEQVPNSSSASALNPCGIAHHW